MNTKHAALAALLTAFCLNINVHADPPPFPDPVTNILNNPYPVTNVPSVDIFGMDYNGPIVNINPGTTNFGTITESIQCNAYYKNYVCATGMTNSQIAWFEITLPPFRDTVTNQVRLLAYELGVNGSSNEKIRVFMKDADDTVWTLLNTVAGTGYNWTYSDPVTWYPYAWRITSATNVTLHVEYDAGPYVSTLLYANNRGCIDYLCWEAAPPDSPFLLRIESAWVNYGNTGCVWGDQNNSLRISWPKNVYTAIDSPGNYRLQMATSLNGPWYFIINSAIHITLENSRYVYYDQPVAGQPAGYFRLHK